MAQKFTRGASDGHMWGTITLYCDNQSSIAIAKNPVQHDPTKHMEINCHYIAENINTGIICLIFVPSAEHIHKRTARPLVSDIGVQAGHG